MTTVFGDAMGNEETAHHSLALFEMKRMVASTSKPNGGMNTI